MLPPESAAEDDPRYLLASEAALRRAGQQCEYCRAVNETNVWRRWMAWWGWTPHQHPSAWRREEDGPFAWDDRLVLIELRVVARNLPWSGETRDLLVLCTACWLQREVDLARRQRSRLPEPDAMAQLFLEMGLKDGGKS